MSVRYWDPQVGGFDHRTREWVDYDSAHFSADLSVGFPRLHVALGRRGYYKFKCGYHGVGCGEKYNHLQDLVLHIRNRRTGHTGSKNALSRGLLHGVALSRPLSS